MITPAQINVLIACEESQAEMKAFRELGFNAWSCDVKSCRYDITRHILGDVTPLLQGSRWFRTQDLKLHHVSKWHLIIAHPPCTYLCKVGSRWLYKNPDTWYTDSDGEQVYLNRERVEKLQQAKDFFYECLYAKADYLAVENPLPMARAELPQPSCYIQPSWFGVKYTKTTLYWLRNLPPILPTIEHPFPKVFVRSSRDHYRSRTFPEVAHALAEQWGKYILDELNRK